MAEEMIRGILIDVEKGSALTIEIERSLRSYNKHLNCNLVDFAVRTVNGVEVEIICDDEGTFAESPYISAIDGNLDAMFVGSIFIVGHDEENCGIRSLTSDECIHVMRNIRRLSTRKHPKPYFMLTKCEYA